jgi:hypothetical protein
VSLFISIVAFIISIVTFYSTLIAKKDELLAVLNGKLVFTSVMIDDHKNVTNIDSDQEISFTNNGNRNIAVLKIELRLGVSAYPLTNAGMGGPCARAERIVDYKFTPMSLKPSKIIVIKLELDRGFKFRPGDERFLVDLIDQHNYYIVACLNFQILTPDELTENKTIPVMSGFVAGDSFFGDQKSDIYSKPIELYQKLSFGL